MYWNTVTEDLKEGLLQFMSDPLFEPFRLVGGTALSLQIGHRISIDIDLFTDALYGSLDFGKIDSYLRANYEYVSPSQPPEIVAMGVSYIIGKTIQNSFKLDLYYTDDFIRPILDVEGVRMATEEEIIAMKVDVVQRGGRKKDFWDLHELLGRHSIPQMIALHQERYPYTHDDKLIERKFSDFSNADDDFDPECLLGKEWEIVKLDIVEALEQNSPKI
jgi:hypothetical protein